MRKIAGSIPERWQDAADAVILKLTQQRNSGTNFYCDTPAVCCSGQCVSTWSTQKGHIVHTPARSLPYSPICKQCCMPSARPRAEQAFSWQSQRFKLDPLSHCVTHRPSFLCPGTNSCLCYGDRKHGKPFHTPSLSQAAPQSNYSWGNNRNFSWITAAASDWEKEYSRVTLHSQILAEKSNLDINWEGQRSITADITYMRSSFIAFRIQILL